MSAHPQPVDVDAGFCPVYECIEPGTECRPSMSAHLQSVRVMSAHLQSVCVDTRRQDPYIPASGIGPFRL